ncbi:MAG TPA: hypothetical protein VF658_12220 [Pyrinomonadaceae bacterium]
MIADRGINLIVPAVIAISAIVIFLLVHPAQKYFFVPAMVIAFVCYLCTSHLEMPVADWIVGPILLRRLWTRESVAHAS